MDETTEKRPCCTETRDAFWTLMGEMQYQAKVLKWTAGFIKNCSAHFDQLARHKDTPIPKKLLQKDYETAIQQAEFAIAQFKSTMNSARAYLRGEEIVVHLTRGGILRDQDEQNRSRNIP